MKIQMKTKQNALRTIMLCCTSLVSFMPATEVFAQSEASADAPGDIIVTARRVEERLQDVPISMTVFSQQELTQRNVAVATDLVAYTPSLTVNQRFGPEKASFSIRGFNQDLNTAPTVGVYFAEVVGVRAQSGNTSGNSVGAGAFTDLANVQVLKGPQGTLFGRNTTGGAILLTPQKPTGDFEGYVEGTYGNYDQKRLQGAINIPLADTFKVRLVGETNQRDGYMKNVSGIETKDFNDVNYSYGRLSIVGDLTPNLENYIVAHYSKSDSNGYGSAIVGCANENSPIGKLVTTPGAPGFNPIRLLQAKSCEVQFARQKARGDSIYEVESRYPNSYLKIQQWQIINTTTWQASDDITIKNIMSYGEYRERISNEFGSSNFVIPNVNGEGGFNLTRYVSPFITGPGGAPLIVPAGTLYDRISNDAPGGGRYNAAQSTATEEVQIQGRSKDGRLEFVLGGYLEFSRPIGYNEATSSLYYTCANARDFVCTNPLAIGALGTPKTKLSFDNHGIFGQGTYNFTEQLALTGGIRMTFDKIVGVSEGTSTRLSTGPGSYIDPRTGVSLLRTCSDTFRHPNTVVGASSTACSTRLTNKSNEPTWLINVDYKPVPDVLLYAKYARGYRQGGVSFAAAGLEVWDPEKMDTYEVGAKASFRGAVSGYFNVAGFYNNLSDQQVFAQVLPTDAARNAGVVGGSVIINAAKSRSYGLEVDAAALFFDSLRLSLGYTYINTKIKDVLTAAELLPRLAGTPFAQAIPQVASGTAFADTPKHKLTANATYTLPLDKALGNLSAGVTWVYTSKLVTSFADPAYINGFPFGVTDPSNYINLNLDWKGVGGSPFDVALFATNVTKEKSKLPNQIGWAISGVAEVAMAPPRFYGLRVRYNFGQ